MLKRRAASAGFFSQNETIKKIFCRYGYVENAFEKEQAAKESK
jgi:hypothetical protein